MGPTAAGGHPAAASALLPTLAYRTPQGAPGWGSADAYLLPERAFLLRQYPASPANGSVWNRSARRGRPRPRCPRARARQAPPCHTCSARICVPSFPHGSSLLPIARRGLHLTVCRPKPPMNPIPRIRGGAGDVPPRSHRRERPLLTARAAPDGSRNASSRRLYSGPLRPADLAGASGRSRGGSRLAVPPRGHASREADGAPAPGRECSPQAGEDSGSHTHTRRRRPGDGIQPPGAEMPAGRAERRSPR